MPEDRIEPLFDSFAVGDAVCPCGITTLNRVTGHQAVTLSVQCQFCGAVIEVGPVTDDE